jgi:hypothetical protein
MREPRESLHFAAPVAATAGAATVPTGALKIADATPFAHTAGDGLTAQCVGVLDRQPTTGSTRSR